MGNIPFSAVTDTLFNEKTFAPQRRNSKTDWTERQSRQWNPTRVYNTPEMCLLMHIHGLLLSIGGAVGFQCVCGVVVGGFFGSSVNRDAIVTIDMVEWVICEFYN